MAYREVARTQSSPVKQSFVQLGFLVFMILQEVEDSTKTGGSNSSRKMTGRESQNWRLKNQDLVEVSKQ